MGKNEVVGQVLKVISSKSTARSTSSPSRPSSSKSIRVVATVSIKRDAGTETAEGRVEGEAPGGVCSGDSTALKDCSGSDSGVSCTKGLSCQVFLDNDLFGLQTLQHLMRMTRTWDSTMSMIPKGWDTIWGYLCSAKKLKNNDTAGQNLNQSLAKSKGVNYERMISFGKDVAEAIGGMKAVADYKIYYTTGSILDLLHFVAPKLMARGGAHFSHGIAENLDDPK